MVHEGTEDEVTAAHDLGWRATLSERVPQLRFESTDEASLIEPFYNLIELEFVEGPQKGRKIEIGFGPRVFGAGHLDIDLIETTAAAECFMIFPVGSAAHAKSLQPEVLLNSQIFSDKQLFEGDFLQVGETMIQVRFKND